MKGRKRRSPCPRCENLQREVSDLERRNAELERRSAELERRVAEQDKVIAELSERLGLNSQNSSLSPSGDPPSAPPRRKKPRSGRKRGGQPGHEPARRELLPVDEVDEVVVYVPPECEHCHTPLPVEASPEDPDPNRHQVTDLPEKVRTVTEHQEHARTCPCCGEVTRAKMPAEIARSSFGPRAVALVSFLVGVCHISRRSALETLRDVFGMDISLGTVSNLEAEVSEALEEPYVQAAEALQEAQIKNVDETGYKKAGLRCWLWTAATAVVAVFAVKASRSRAALHELLGETIRGILITDRYSAYSHILNRLRQICWAHLKRDFRRAADRGGEAGKIGTAGLAIHREIFLRWEFFKNGIIDRPMLQKLLAPERQRLRELLEHGQTLDDQKTATFCSNLLDLEAALWTFAYEDGVEPTNNHAERVLRGGVLWRKRSFGADSERGCRFAERILTAVKTLRLQRRPVFAFLVDAVEARRSASAPPSLLPD